MVKIIKSSISFGLSLILGALLLLLLADVAFAQSAGAWSALGSAGPTAVTDITSSVSGSSVTLNGTVVPNGSATDAWFEWSTDASLSLSLTNKTGVYSAGSGYSPISYSLSISGLVSNKTYYYRAVAHNDFGTGYGEIKNFISGSFSSPSSGSTIVTNAAPTFTTPSGIILNAREGDLLTYRFQAVSNNGNIVIYRVINAPDGVFINASTGLLAWVPNHSHGRVEPYTVTVGASNSVQESLQSILIKVEDVSVASAPVVVRSFEPVKEKLTSFDIRVEAEDNGDIIVLWETNLPATHRVVYDTVSEADPNKDFHYANATPESDELTTNHKVNLGQLEIGTTYYFRTVSKTADQMDISRERIFVRLADGQINLGLASALGTLGGLFFSPWVLFIAIPLLTFILWRKGKKQNLLIK